MLKTCACFCLILYVARKNIVEGAICDNYDPKTLSQILLKVYRGINSSHYTSTNVMLTNPESIADVLVTDQDTVLYIHGFLENYESDNVLTVIKAYLDKGGTNIIQLDWGSLTLNVNYYFVANQVAMIGKALAEFLYKTEKWINLDRLHAIGHSLGAHVAGQIGRNLKHGTLSRITGLDPAGPLFYPSSCHIKPSDAKVVVTIHTDSKLYGTPYLTGSVDFFPNENSANQPGCSSIIGAVCNHHRSVKYYIESLKNPKAFPAHKCFGNQGGTDDEEVYFGESTTPNAHGTYCFSTNDHPPFGKTSPLRRAT